MSNVLILFASLKEANSFIYQSGINFEKISKKEYRHRNISVYITGVGKKSIEKIDLTLFEDITFIIKAGACALLDDNMSLCQAYIPSIVQYKSNKFQVDFSNLPSKVRDSFNKLIINKTLLTQDKPLFDDKKTTDLFNSGISFVDMETFFVIEKFRNIPVIPLIVGTDKGGKDAKKFFFRMLPKASGVIKDELVKLLK